MGISTVVVTSACSGKIDDTPQCTLVPSPPVLHEKSIARLDVLDLGETTRAADAHGFDLDGVCTDRRKPDSESCRRFPGADSFMTIDTDGGVDNNFSRWLLGYIQAVIGKPSETMSGHSYLVTEPDGSGTLYLGTSTGIRIVIPLVRVRIARGENGALSTLAAIAPRAELIASVRARFSLVYSGGPDHGCGYAPQETVATAIAQASDILVSGDRNPDVECDGISVGLRFASSPVDAPPSVGRGCVPTETDEDVTKQGARWRSSAR